MRHRDPSISLGVSHGTAKKDGKTPTPSLPHLSIYPNPRIRAGRAGRAVYPSIYVSMPGRRGGEEVGRHGHGWMELQIGGAAQRGGSSASMYAASLGLNVGGGGMDGY